MSCYLLYFLECTLSPGVMLTIAVLGFGIGTFMVAYGMAQYDRLHR